MDHFRASDIQANTVVNAASCIIDSWPQAQIWAALNIEVLRAEKGEASDGMQGRGKREIPEGTRWTALSSGTIPTCEKIGSDPARNRARFALVGDGSHGGRAVSLLASHQGVSGSIPDRVTPDFRKWESCRTPLTSPSSALKTSTHREQTLSRMAGWKNALEFLGWMEGGISWLVSKPSNHSTPTHRTTIPAHEEGRGEKGPSSDTPSSSSHSNGLFFRSNAKFLPNPRDKE
ncbi:hypothetical protein PR048_027840 [Dryococelus australis]|uniref:Uncharacterized protein n=1 Tax=Dryococelus australis TaxID=614101 RepID=A0ABQ9GHM8_9NEOP|nr:hypothetical protein PR048_027840 [Dryococelus australis]